MDYQQRPSSPKRSLSSDDNNNNNTPSKESKKELLPIALNIAVFFESNTSQSLFKEALTHAFKMPYSLFKLVCSSDEEHDPYCTFKHTTDLGSITFDLFTPSRNDDTPMTSPGMWDLKKVAKIKGVKYDLAISSSFCQSSEELHDATIAICDGAMNMDGYSNREPTWQTSNLTFIHPISKAKMSFNDIISKVNDPTCLIGVKSGMSAIDLRDPTDPQILWAHKLGAKTWDRLTFLAFMHMINVNIPIIGINIVCNQPLKNKTKIPRYPTPFKEEDLTLPERCSLVWARFFANFANQLITQVHATQNIIESAPSIPKDIIESPDVKLQKEGKHNVIHLVCQGEDTLLLTKLLNLDKYCLLTLLVLVMMEKIISPFNQVKQIPLLPMNVRVI
jgi:hypothetical protein